MPQPSSPASPRRPLVRLVRVARTAAPLLLATWFGPVSFEQSIPLLRGAVAPAGASAESITEFSTVPTGQALVLTPGTAISLRLRDGKVVHGRFMGRAIQDSAAYAERFAARDLDHAAGALTLGETLRVVTLDGRESVAPFAGWAEMALLLRGPADAPVLHVPFEFARSIARADGSPVDVAALKKSFRNGDLPSADMLVLGAKDPVGTEEERWASALRVPADDIKSVSAPSAKSDHAGVTGLLVLAVGVTALALIILATQQSSQSYSSGCENVGAVPFSMTAVPRTDRPFDLSRGRFVDDPLTQAEVWSDAPSLAAR